MKLAMEIFFDEEVRQWGYRVHSLSIVGTGCRSRDEAERLGWEAIRFALEDDDHELEDGSETVMFDVDITRTTVSR